MQDMENQIRDKELLVQKVRDWYHDGASGIWTHDRQRPRLIPLKELVSLTKLDDGPLKGHNRQLLLNLKNFLWLRSPVWTNLDLAIYEISATSGLAEVVKIW